MDIDISQLQAGDLFMCTGPDGVTYKTEGSAVMMMLDENYEPPLPPPPTIDEINPGAPESETAYNDITWSSKLGLYVATGYRGTNRARYSRNGKNWSEVNIGSANWKAVCYSPELSKFVSVYNKVTSISTTGTSGWVEHPQPAWFKDLNDIKWYSEKGLFIATSWRGSEGFVFDSPDGINWTPRKNSQGNFTPSYGTAYSSELDLFVCPSGGSSTRTEVNYSSNGKDWTPVPTGTSGTVYRPMNTVAYSPKLKKFVTSSYSISIEIERPHLGISYDGVNWDFKGEGEEVNGYKKIIWVDEFDTFFGVRDNLLFSSADGENWIQYDQELPIPYIQSFCYSPELNQLGFCGNDASTTRLLTVELS